ncbi:GGDEF domain-containing protein [Marinagarivorans algicola]|uniref:GGDEF domain-containing protein n=1 Tax=Marinagarivorans algicola TaxID=1513270 RepID=UPI0037370C7E
MALASSSRIRAAAVIATVVVMLGHYFLPPRYITVHPVDNSTYNIYSDGDWGGESSVAWLDKSATRWLCHFKKSPAHPVCGLAVHWGDARSQFINAEGYSLLRLTLKYKGPAHALRIYIRNFDEQHGVLEDRDTHKFMSVNIPADEFSQFEARSHSTEIALSELQVADWWKSEYNVDRHQAKPAFNRMTSFGIDFPVPPVMGEHTLELERVELVGTWIPAENLYLGIILAWLLGLLLETAWHMYRWRRVAKENFRQVKDLTDYAEALKLKSEKYRELSHIDSLTKVYNRYGFMQTLKKLFGRGALNGCLMIIDIDYFKKINDNFGHVAGDKILHEIAQVFAQNVRKNDVFARWGGEEFVLLVTHYDLKQARALAEKLRLLIKDYDFNTVQNIQVTISIGLTSFSKSDSLNSAFLRADEALYSAKTQGRNQVVIACND